MLEKVDKVGVFVTFCKKMVQGAFQNVPIAIKSKVLAFLQKNFQLVF